MTKSSLHHSTSAKRHAHAARIARRAGYASGGAIDEGDKEAVHKHESHLHKGEPKTKLKAGGAAPGKKPAHRMDKRARGGSNGDPEIYDEKPKREEWTSPLKHTNVDSEGPPKRAHGGRTHGKGRGKTNIIIHAGGDGQNPMALQQAKQEGAKMGAMAVIGKLKQAQMGAGAPGGMPPGAPPGPPPGAGAPPGMAPPMPPMHKDGGVIQGELDARKAGPERLDRIKKTDERKGEIPVRAHTRRRSGGSVDAC